MDEVHKLTELLQDKRTKKIKNLQVLRSLRKSFKALLMTGTLFNSDIADMRIALNLLTPTLNSTIPLHYADFTQKYFYWTQQSKALFQTYTYLHQLIQQQKYHKLYFILLVIQAPMILAIPLLLQEMLVQITGNPKYSAIRGTIKDMRNLFSLAFQPEEGKTKMQTLKKIGKEQVVGHEIWVSRSLNYLAQMGFGVTTYRMLSSFVSLPQQERDFMVMNHKLLCSDISKYVSYYVPPILDIRHTPPVLEPSEAFATLRVNNKVIPYTDAQRDLFWQMLSCRQSLNDIAGIRLPHLKRSTKFEYKILQVIKGPGLMIGNTGADIPKFAEVLQTIRKYNQPSVVYSQFRQGILSFEKYLVDHNFPDFRTLYVNSDIKSTVAWLMAQRGKAAILLLGHQYVEGVSIFGARSLHLLEPVELDSTRLQLAGRVRRYMGHSHLPIEERNVLLYQWACTFKDSPKINVQFDAFVKASSAPACMLYSPFSTPDEIVSASAGRLLFYEKSLRMADCSIQALENTEETDKPKCQIWLSDQESGTCEAEYRTTEKEKEE
jgi:hypothetical protein